mgnify:FL=1|jgi:hypothetical protein
MFPLVLSIWVHGNRPQTENMKKELAAIIPISLIAMLALFLFGCEGWQLEYHDPDAQFLADEVASKGKKFIGKKITIKGFVDKVDLSDPDNAWVHLKNGIQCNFGHLSAMAKHIGEEEKVQTEEGAVYVDGFLKICEEGKVVLDPATGRDHRAHFKAQ